MHYLYNCIVTFNGQADVLSEIGVLIMFYDLSQISPPIRILTKQNY